MSWKVAELSKALTPVISVGEDAWQVVVRNGNDHYTFEQRYQDSNASQLDGSIVTTDSVFSDAEFKYVCVPRDSECRNMMIAKKPGVFFAVFYRT